MNRRALLASTLAAPLAAACAPRVQPGLTPPPGFGGLELTADAMVMGDGTRLPCRVWMPSEGQTWGALVCLHGMNDHGMAWHLAGPWWAARGVAVFACDQRGFGAAPGRGVWAGEARMAEDLRQMTALVRARHPGVTLGVVGESMGGAVAVSAFASSRPPDADRLILLAPAVWGWSSQPWTSRAGLWLAARLMGGIAASPPDWAVRDLMATDNLPELRRMSRDPGMIFETRFDTLYGLVGLMEGASGRLGALPGPTLLAYGGRDQIIPPAAMARALAVAGEPAGLTTAFYPEGRHLLVRDLDRARVLGDVLAFLRDPARPLPSGPAGVRAALAARGSVGP
ncbi:alpha/beta fold hydrolase [Brevundimonas sp.]|uniref:alpha/beta fold hydrolase n=1 Tax=Brevundimonas sp. TaxID=1871086 RepID=UPI0022C91283|nr:alpha/beta fold hydrolase [Brevundimonas sp.]MCZ8194436.1 alpha/beta fold hydrolase [Brevundimonas sp.]